MKVFIINEDLIIEQKELLEYDKHENFVSVEYGATRRKYYKPEWFETREEAQVELNGIIDKKVKTLIGHLLELNRKKYIFDEEIVYVLSKIEEGV